MIRRLATHAWRITYARYLAASVTALACDFALFIALMRGGLPPVPASMTGYMAGLAVHWLISSRLVFTDRRATSAGTARMQKLLFIGSALVGLAITAAIVGLGHMLGLDPRLAKLGAIVVSFQATYLLRRSIVFA